MKQKRIISMLLSLVMMLSMTYGVVTEASAQEIDVTSFTYVVDNMKFFADGEEVGSVSDAKEVSVDVTRRTLGTSTDKLILSLYSSSGKYINSYTREVNLDFTDTISHNIPISVDEGETISEIRAYVWNGLNTAVPLSNSLSSKSNVVFDLKKEYTVYNFDTTSFETSGAIDLKKIHTNTINFYETDEASRSTEYKLAGDNLKLYVNGAEVKLTDVTAYDNYITYVLENKKTTKITLFDMGNEDGIYDAICVDYYVTAMIDQITDSNDIKLKYIDGTTETKTISINTETNSNLSYNILLDGEEAELSDLQKNDVVSIAYDVTRDMADSYFYEIYASRNVVSGMLTGIYPDDEIVRIGGKNYSFTKPNFASATSAMTIAEEYTIYLDAFAKIFHFELCTSNIKYAVLDNIRDNGDEWRVTIFTADGEKKQLCIDKTKGKVVNNMTNTTASAGAQLAALQSIVFVSGTSGTKNPVENRVIEYKVSSSSGDIRSITLLMPEANTIEVAGLDKTSEFKARTMSAGNVKMSDATKVINANEYKDNSYGTVSDLTAGTVSLFIDGNEYEAYAYGDKMTDGTYPLVIVVAGIMNEEPEDDEEVVITTESGILDNIRDNGDEWRATIFTADGEKKQLYIDKTKGKVVNNMTNTTASAGAQLAALQSIVFVSGTSGMKVPVENRVIEYKVSPSTGNITSITLLMPEATTIEVAGSDYTSEFKARTMSAGNVKMSNATKVINANEYVDNFYGSVSDLTAGTVSLFIDGNEYEAYAYGDKMTDGTYPLVIVVAGIMNEEPEEPEEPSIATAETAIIDNVRDSGDEWTVTLFTTNGETKKIFIDKTKGKVIDGATTATAGAQLAMLQSKVFVSGVSGTKNPVENRVIEYKVSSTTGNVVEIKFLEQQANTYVSEEDLTSTFSATRNTIGNIKMSDNTSVVNAIEYSDNYNQSISDLRIDTVSLFKDGRAYIAYAYGDKLLDETYPLVLVTNGQSGFDKNSRFAVITSTTPLLSTNESGDLIGKLYAFYNGEETVLEFSEDIDFWELTKGDVIFFETDPDGYIDLFQILFSMDRNKLFDYYNMLRGSIVNRNYDIKNGLKYVSSPEYLMLGDFVPEWYANVDDAIQLVYGPVVDAGDGYLSIGQIDSMMTDTSRTITSTSTNAVYEIEMTEETNIYSYDYSKGRYHIAKENYVEESSVTYASFNSDYINWNLTLYDKDGDGRVSSTETDVIAEDVSLALALVVDGVAVDVFVLANYQ